MSNKNQKIPNTPIQENTEVRTGRVVDQIHMVSTLEEEEAFREIEKRQNHNLNSAPENKIIIQKGTQ